MKSFGLWYKEKEGVNQEKPEFSLHVNFWSESIKTKKNKKRLLDLDKRLPYLDIGIKILNYSLIENVTFQCPFKIEKSQLIDLSDKLSKKRNANLIFNTDGEIETKDNYSLVKLDKNNSSQDLLIFPLEQSLDNIYKIEVVNERTNIIFTFSDFIKYIASKHELKQIKAIYIRFRIKTDTLMNAIYFDSEPLNKSFDSAFSGTRIIDFKINEKRNLDETCVTKMVMDGQNWSEFSKIHLLIMEPSAYDVESFSNDKMTCRELEGELWDDYLGEKIDLTKGHILAYHWKSEGNFSCLVKVRYSRAKISTILAYILIAISLGILGSLIVSFTQDFFQNQNLSFVLVDLIVAIILFGMGLFIGRTKK